MIRTTLIAATIATAALFSGAANAASMSPASQAVTDAPAYTKYLHRVAKRSDYERCARFSLSVLNACIEQAKGDPQRQRSCRQHYQGNIVRCQGLR